MKAAYLTAPGQIAMEEIERHSIGGGDLLMRMGATSICGTDLRIFKNGHFKIPEGQKRVLGHELTGEIVEVGSRVKGYGQGMRVALAPNIGCGVCGQCIQGQINICPDYDAFGITLDGGFQEYVVIPEFAVRSGCIVEIPENISYEEAALAEPLSCVHNSYNYLRTRPGDNVLIIGAGPIGALHTALHRSAGGTRIMVADLSSSRLEAVKAFGADITINSGEQDLKEAVMEYTGGKGADVIVTAASVASLQALSLELAAQSGRISFFGGLPSGKDKVELATNLIHYRQLSIFGTTGSTYTDHRISMDLIASGRIDVKPLISKRFQVAETAEAFRYALSGEGMKSFIVGEQ